MIMSSLSTDQVKLAAAIVSNGGSIQHAAFSVNASVKVVSRCIDAYNAGKKIVTRAQIYDACTLNNAELTIKKLKSIGVVWDKPQLKQWCKNNGVSMVGVYENTRLTREKIKSIKDALHNDEILTLQEVADFCRVSLFAVWRISREIGVKKKPHRRLSESSKTVIRELYESTNGMSVAQLVEKTGLERNSIRSGIRVVQRRPSEYEMEQGRVRGVMTYKITAITVSRKSQKANDRRVRMREMIASGDTNEMIANELKCSNATIDKLRDVMSPRQGIKKPSSMNPAMAAFLGIKL